MKRPVNDGKWEVHSAVFQGKHTDLVWSIFVDVCLCFLFAGFLYWLSFGHTYLSSTSPLLLSSSALLYRPPHLYLKSVYMFSPSLLLPFFSMPLSLYFMWLDSPPNRHICIYICSQHLCTHFVTQPPCPPRICRRSPLPHHSLRTKHSTKRRTLRERAGPGGCWREGWESRGPESCDAGVHSACLGLMLETPVRCWHPAGSMSIRNENASLWLWL